MVMTEDLGKTTYYIQYEMKHGSSGWYNELWLDGVKLSSLEGVFPWYHNSFTTLKPLLTITKTALHCAIRTGVIVASDPSAVHRHIYPRSQEEREYIGRHERVVLCPIAKGEKATPCIPTLEMKRRETIRGQTPVNPIY